MAARGLLGKDLNNRCRYQSITQQYLNKCLIKGDNNYVFRPIAAIIRFSSEGMVIVLYGIGMVMSRDLLFKFVSNNPIIIIYYDIIII